MSILFHIAGVIALIQVVTHFTAGKERHPRSGEALGIMIPILIAYVIWLVK
jgi:hypothetical protein